MVGPRATAQYDSQMQSGIQRRLREQYAERGSPANVDAAFAEPIHIGCHICGDINLSDDGSGRCLRCAADLGPETASEERQALTQRLDAIRALAASARVDLGLYRNQPGYWRESPELDNATDALESIVRLCSEPVGGQR